MHLEISDDSLSAAVRRIVREEIAASFESQAAQLKVRPATPALADMPEPEPIPEGLKGVSPYDMRRYAEYVLEEAGGGPLHVSAIAQRMYRLGFEHRRPPKDPNQILSSLNSLASPSQHPDRFRRSGPRMLELVD